MKSRNLSSRPQNDKIPRLRATIRRTSLGMTLILPTEISQAFALRVRHKSATPSQSYTFNY